MQPLPDLNMSLKDAMMTQRSVRRVKPDPVDDALVLQLIELALIRNREGARSSSLVTNHSSLP